jgi:hypothetical protein
VPRARSELRALGVGLGRALLIAAVLVASVACGETTGPSATEESSPSAAEPPASAEPSAVAQTVVRYLNAPLTVARGHNATLMVQTSPNTSCSIEVDYASGPSSAAGLVTKNSDGAGNVSWTWKVGTNTTRGSWPITVTCGSGSAQTNITVK